MFVFIFAVVFVSDTVQWLIADKESTVHNPNYDHKSTFWTLHKSHTYLQNVTESDKMRRKT